MESDLVQTGLSGSQVQSAIAQVNSQGFVAVKLPPEIIEKLGETLYRAIDAVTFHRQRLTYYNEIAFYWPEDWSDVEQGIGAFHEQKSLANILPASIARNILDEKIGVDKAEAIFNFASEIKNLVVNHHHGLANNELRLARVMVRQMNENQITTHSGSEVHEDIGYSGRPYQQLLLAMSEDLAFLHSGPQSGPKMFFFFEFLGPS